MFTMRFAFATVVGVSALAAVMHSQGGPIEWSPERKLTIQDFTGAVPTIAQQGKTQQGALSFLRIEI